MGNSSDRQRELNIQLCHAAEQGDLNLVKSLIQRGADIHGQKGDVLYEACRKGHLEVIKYLVDMGADVKSNSMYDGVLWQACYFGHLAVAQFLVEKGVNVDNSIDRAHYFASSQGHNHIVAFLDGLQKKIEFVESKETPFDTIFSRINVEPINEPENQCNYCLANRKNICFLPCGHITACKDCAKEIITTRSKCPSCQTNIVNVCKIFY